MQVHQFQPAPVNCSTGLVYSSLADGDLADCQRLLW